MRIGFKDILGNEQIKEHFQRAIENKKVSHAYILTGEAGMGRKTLAKAFAMTLQCESGDTEPCYECSSCKQFLSDNHPDITYVSHEKVNSIGIDDVREQINGDMMIKPYKSPYKIYILGDAEKMTVQAQNALLKTLEEPPPYGIIILVTTNLDSFLPTILSRCVILKLKPLYDQVIKEHIIQNLAVTESQAEICTAFARGNLGKAVRFAASESFMMMREKCLDLLKHVKDLDIVELVILIRKLEELMPDTKEYLDFIQFWYRDVLMLKVTNNLNLLIFKDEYSAINRIAQTSSFEGLEFIIQAIDKARVRLNANVNFELAMELMLLTMKEN